MRGLVTKSTGSWYEVLTDEGTIQARLRGKFRHKGNKLTNPIAVGDYVIYDVLEDKTAFITEIEDRKNHIVRKSTKKTGRAHIIASNLDQAVIIATIGSPSTSQGFIDKCLVTAEAYGIEAKIIFNKQDILTEKQLAKQTALIEVYTACGYKCFTTSVSANVGKESISGVFDNKFSLIMGHSGVGKSTILNWLYPSLNLKTGEISEYSDKGTHTTTFAEMLNVKEKTYVIDSPGVNEFDLYDINKNNLSQYFPEMRRLIGQCKFNDCIHVNEPHCAVIEAMINEEISEKRYTSYLYLLDEIEKEKEDFR